MIEIPVSNGELLDKISILEIKVTMGIVEAQKELDLLKRKSKKIYLNIITEGLYKSLKTINSHLWLIEDTKRSHETDENFGKHFIEAFSGRIINIHPSLLPAFPGLNVQKRALEHGARFSGCTVHFVNEEVDGGPIISQAVVPIFDDDNEASLSERILEQEHIIYPEAIRLILEGKLTLSGRRTIRNK